MRILLLDVSVLYKQKHLSFDAEVWCKPGEDKKEKTERLINSALQKLEKGRALMAESFQEETEVNRLLLGLDT